MTTIRPVFVTGCARSGTTMLQYMLHAHSRIAIAPENHLVLNGYRRRHRFGDLGQRANREKLAQWIVGHKASRFADFGLDAAELTEEIVEGPPTLGSAFGIVFRAFSRRFGKVRWGDKRPAYILNLPTLLRLFPDAQVVHIVRDGRDCVASLKEMPWYRGDVYTAINRWARSIDQGQWARRTMSPGSFHELHYERLVTEPEPELVALCRFLGEEYEPAMVKPADALDELPRYRAWYHSRNHDDVTTDRIGRWSGSMQPWELGLCEAVLGSRLRAHGYELSGASRPPASHRLRYEMVAGRNRYQHLRQVWQDRRAEPGTIACRIGEEPTEATTAGA
ncbi:sulfotransferase family protein [Krasilnikovia sp. M28-CT-15]|uniref:sulfotransferase family protein n=1 Tax=Krasilnikovia sp. M28-CT-15 TaxID=3373540 RepID=UPI003876AA06